jgi:hypothetical protein
VRCFVTQRMSQTAARLLPQGPSVGRVIHRTVANAHGRTSLGNAVTMTTQLGYPHWRDQFVLSREERALERHSEMVRDIRRGALVPVTRGVYRHTTAVTRDEHRAAEDAALARVRAAHLVAAEPPVFAALSAAAIWGLPVIGPWPERVQTASAQANGGRSNVHVTRSIVGHPVRCVTVDGLSVTTLARTVIDVGRTSSFETAVVIADAALRGAAGGAHGARRRAVSITALWAELARLGSAPGVAKCGRVLSFANAKAASPGESLSRVTMLKLGLSEPILQHDFFDREGRMAVDFWWPDFRVIGEFDGAGKYLREEFSGGKSTAELLLDEKAREDRLRALDTTVVRWGWAQASSRSKLWERLGRRLG